MSRGNANLASSARHPGPTSELPAPTAQPHSRTSAGVRFAQSPSHPRSLSRGRSRTRRPDSRSVSKGALEHSDPHNRGKSLLNDAGATAMDPGTSDPAPPKSAYRRPPAARGNADQHPPPKSWAAVAKSATKGYNLSYLPPATVGNKMRVTISADILHASNPKWDECLVGYLIGKKLPFKLVEAAMKHVWGAQLVDTLANDDGFFFFHIPDIEFRKEILESGPLTIAKVPLVLQQWHSLINLEKKKHEAVPIWIRLRNIPFSLWSAIGISAVASAVGRPLYVDSQTEKMRMLSYARVCVEIRAGVGLPDVIEVDMMDDIRTVKVEYEWRPSYCPTCVSFGHKCPATIADQQGKSPVLSPSRVVSPANSPQQQPLEEIWTEVSSRKRHTNQQPEAPNQNLNMAIPSARRNSPSSLPTRYSVLGKELEENSEDNAHSEEDLGEPLFVKSSIPNEVDTPLLQPDCPDANTRAAHSNIQVLGLPSSSNPVIKSGDPCMKSSCARIYSSVSEDNDSSHDEAVESQQPILICSVPPEVSPSQIVIPPVQGRGTRSSKGNKGQPPGGTSNSSLPPHSLKSSKGRKNVR